MAASVEIPPPPSDRRVEETKTLIAALNLLSRNLPLPPDVFRAVSSIYHGDPSAPTPEKAEADTAPPPEEDVEQDGGPPSPGRENLLDSTGGTLISELEDSLLKQQLSRMSSLALKETLESRFNSLIKHRLTELEG